MKTQEPKLTNESRIVRDNSSNRKARDKTNKNPASLPCKFHLMRVRGRFFIWWFQCDSSMF